MLKVPSPGTKLDGRPTPTSTRPLLLGKKTRVNMEPRNCEAWKKRTSSPCFWVFYDGVVVHCILKMGSTEGNISCVASAVLKFMFWGPSSPHHVIPSPQRVVQHQPSKLQTKQKSPSLVTSLLAGFLPSTI